jgi:hypothetical protein
MRARCAAACQRVDNLCEAGRQLDGIEEQTDPEGRAGIARWAKSGEDEQVVLNLLFIAAVPYYSDLRLRLGIDLLLGSFAGSEYEQVLRQRRSKAV